MNDLLLRPPRPAEADVQSVRRAAGMQVISVLAPQSFDRGRWVGHAINEMRLKSLRPAISFHAACTGRDREPGFHLIERGMSVMLDCESCLHVATWTAADIARRFGGHADKSFSWLGPRLRCRHCRSEWVRISLAPSGARR